MKGTTKRIEKPLAKCPLLHRGPEGPFQKDEKRKSDTENCIRSGQVFGKCSRRWWQLYTVSCNVRACRMEKRLFSYRALVTPVAHMVHMDWEPLYTEMSTLMV